MIIHCYLRLRIQKSQYALSLLHYYFRLYTKELYIELFVYLIEKQNIYIRNRYPKNIPPKNCGVSSYV